MNPRHIAIDPKVFETLDKFCSKHGFKKRNITEQAIISEIKKLQEKLN